ncbi:MAG: hypothetical protein HYW07_14340 [Candidatus Latescibacteria bacterium]|nr:hypothetical protein [Candidatus Latescibacterota bacterium]
MVPAGHRYGLPTIERYITLVQASVTSLRGASRALPLLAEPPEAERTPVWTTGRGWWLRLGYYKLTRAKTVATDWVWIVDHTIQLGAEKCLVILGVRLSELPTEDLVLHHEQVEPLAVLPVRHSDRKVVCAQLEATQQRTGMPREILSDHGSDLHAGISDYCQAHPSCCAVYDIKHQTAAVLKKELHHDASWETFTNYAHQVRIELQQTSVAALAPPNQRSKARYLNLEGLIRWGQRGLQLLEQPQRLVDAGLDPAQVQARLGGLTWFRSHVAEWQGLLDTVMTAEHLVRHRGLDRGCLAALETAWPVVAPSESIARVQQHLRTFVATESQKAHDHERLLGSSEVLESVLGKLKYLEGDRASHGFTQLLLSVPALVATTTREVIRQALESVPRQKLREWADQHLGKSLQTQRRMLFAGCAKKEQNRVQLEDAA